MTSPKTDAELQDAYRELIQDTVRWLEPGSLPLMPAMQAIFIHSTLTQAKAIYDSEPFLRAQVVATAAKVQAFNHP
jgi:hypothetical protein